MRTLLSPLALCACLCAVGSPLAQESDADVRREIEFARGLARERGAADLCERVLAGVERAPLSPPLRDELALARAEIYFEAAHHDSARRSELLAKSMDSYRAYISSARGAEPKAAAEAGLVEVWSYYAHDVERRHAGATGADATRLANEWTAALRATAAKSAELAALIANKPRASRSEVEQRRWRELVFTQADMLLGLGRAIDDRAGFEQAEQVLNKLRDDAGPGTPWDARALIGLGDVAAARGEYAAAADDFAGAVEFAIRRDVAQWSELGRDMPRDEKRSRFVLAETALPGLLRALEAEGRTPEALAWGLHFHNVARRERLELGDPDGYLALLEIARCAAGAGGFVAGDIEAGESVWSAARTGAARSGLEFALALARRVTEFGAGNELGALGHELLCELIARPGAVVEPSVWSAAATSAFDDGRAPGRLLALQRVASALGDADPATRRKWMPQVLNGIGLAFRLRGRDLEAALCFEHALDHWRGESAIDAANARGLVNACEALAFENRDDAPLDALKAKAQRIAAEILAAPDAQREFEQADEAFAAGDWRRVTALLDGYAERFPTQTSFAPAALYRTVAAHARLGEFEPMRAQLAQLATRFPASGFTAQAALAACDALEIACNAATDEPTKTALRREMALDLRTLDRATPAPNFEALRRESQLWLACGDWKAAEETLRRIEQWFVNDPERERVVQFVLPDLARALLAQHKAQAAAEVLGPLIDGARATRESAHDYARALAGWVESASANDGAAGSIVEVPGVGGAANLARALELFDRLIASSTSNGTPEWFALQFDALYARRQYASIDGRQLAPAQGALGDLRAQLGPEFTNAGLPEELRRKFVWLAEALK